MKNLNLLFLIFLLSAFQLVYSQVSTLGGAAVYTESHYVPAVNGIPLAVDVDPTGRSRYITEGGLLLEHRKVSKNPWSETVPYHSFKRSDAAPMPVHEIEEITFKLWPTSVLVKEGHSLRIAIAGADKDTFDRVPEEGAPVYKIYRSKSHVSFIDLPILN